ncbi:hypothetical protein [Pseudomonas knackmussii]|uniref:hypothetical protein n=1 Tax=Pseudomonas knackmussii TaxID=65741 RepID=UPI0013639082|nr:hypothetical protein [Pseudomonas knackmussii]
MKAAEENFRGLQMEDGIFSDEKLLELIDSAVERVLDEAGIYNIDHYGWSDIDTVDPDFVGHAMWQVSPPYEFSLYGSRPSRRPSELDRILTVSGSDFIGLMHAARETIGLCLLHKDSAAKRPFDTDKKFWLHHASSMMLLNIASDRVRSFFVAARFNCSPVEYDKKGKKSKQYTAPFIEAWEGLHEDDVSLKSLLEEIKQLSNNVFESRGKRNKLVHEVLSRDGSMHVRLMDMEQESFDNSCEKLVSASDSEFSFPDIDYVFEKNNKELLEAVMEVVGWYKVLAKFSGLVFEVEHHLRNYRTQ